MHKKINSSELAKKISETLHLSQADGLNLYKELSQIPNGFVKDVLEDLLKNIENNLNTVAGQNQTTIYAACIKGSSVRDAQYEKAADSDHLDDNAWLDANEMPLFLEIIKAATPTRAIQIAAAHAGVNENVIELFPMEQKGARVQYGNQSI